MKSQSDWDEIFRDGHLHSWPTASLCIQNVNPSPSQGSRNIFKDDRKMIEAAAKSKGYRQCNAGGPIIHFIRD